MSSISLIQSSLWIELRGLDEVTAMLNRLGKSGYKIITEMNQEGAKVAIALLNKTTNNWRHKVTFESEVRAASFMYQAIFIATDDPIWNMLDEGTRPHRIAAKNPTGRLRFFSSGFVPKTYPMTMHSGAGTRASYDFVTPQVVQHPGTIARKWGWQTVNVYGDNIRSVMMNFAVQEYAKVIGG